MDNTCLLSYKNYKEIDELDDNKKVGYIYLVSWIDDREEANTFNQTVYYVGQHTTNKSNYSIDKLISDGYYGSGKLIRSYIRRNNLLETKVFGIIPDISKDILEYPIIGQPLIDECEKYWINLYFKEYGPFLLNIEEGGKKGKEDRVFLPRLGYN